MTNCPERDDKDPFPDPGPFLKDVWFAQQAEIRIVLRPWQKIQHETLIVTLPHPEHLFVEEFRALPPV
jgi:hypothetical protein